ncbi:hypothetical protein K440DRAFT_635930 [Wilcoxina mikolae CBS 423.85]|nr:hypothetical protein K440DRAFT_635930 [Wilcoxina mikolae CBS 423.85]
MAFAILQQLPAMKILLSVALAINYALAYQTVALNYDTCFCKFSASSTNGAVLDEKVYMFTSGWRGIDDNDPSRLRAYSYIAEIDWRNSVSIDDYSSQYYIIGSNTRDTELSTFDPKSRIIDTVPWPVEILPNKIPTYGHQIVVPDQNVSYHFTTDFYTSSTNLTKYYITTRKWNVLDCPARFWDSGTFVPIGQKGILVNNFIHVFDGRPTGPTDIDWVDPKVTDNHWILSIPSFI